MAEIPVTLGSNGNITGFTSGIDTLKITIPSGTTSGTINLPGDFGAEDQIEFYDSSSTKITNWEPSVSNNNLTVSFQANGQEVTLQISGIDLSEKLLGNDKAGFVNVDNVVGWYEENATKSVTENSIENVDDGGTLKIGYESSPLFTVSFPTGSTSTAESIGLMEDEDFTVGSNKKITFYSSGLAKLAAKQASLTCGSDYSFATFTSSKTGNPIGEGWSDNNLTYHASGTSASYEFTRTSKKLTYKSGNGQDPDAIFTLNEKLSNVGAKITLKEI